MRSAGTRASSYSWSLWGTYAFLAVEDPLHLDEARSVADELLTAIEAAVSRFHPGSDLVRANAAAGTWADAGPLLVGAVRAALWAAQQTDGLVDPCLGRALVSLGYDDDLGVVHRRASWTPPTGTPRLGAWRELEVTDTAVRVPAGAALDLGATGKAWAADLVASTVAAELGCATVVSLGGDVSVQGPAAEWPVQVSETPGAPGILVQVWGGIATSTILARRWRGPAGTVVHHLLDPRTGRPVVGALRTVTCAGSDALAANTASTAALVLGDDAAAWLAWRGVAARLVDVHGRVTTVDAWPGEQ